MDAMSEAVAQTETEAAIRAAQAELDRAEQLARLDNATRRLRGRDGVDTHPCYPWAVGATYGVVHSHRWQAVRPY